jgi:fucose permease
MNDRRYLTLALSLCYAAMMCLAICINLMPVFLTTLGADLGHGDGLTHEQLGRIAAATFAGLVVGILLTGPLADRVGAKPFAVIGNLVIAGGLALLGLAPGYDVVLAAVFIMGLGAGILDMVLSPIVCALQPEKRAAAMNWLHSFYCVGAVVTVLAGTVALRAGIGWRTVSLALIAGPMFVAAGFLRLKLPELVAERRTGVRQLFANPFFIAALVGIFLGGATELGMAQWLPAYAETQLGYSRATGGVALLAFSVAMALGRMLAGVLGTRIAPVRLMLHCCWTTLILFIVACFAPWRTVALAACVGVGFSGSCLWPSMLGVAADRFPHGGASMFGLLAALGNLGGIFMPWLVGAASDASAMNIGLVTAAVCPVLLFAVLIWMQRQGAPVATTA